MAMISAKLSWTFLLLLGALLASPLPCAHWHFNNNHKRNNSNHNINNMLNIIDSSVSSPVGLSLIFREFGNRQLQRMNANDHRSLRSLLLALVVEVRIYLS
jgi:hypothetical protein